MNLLDASNQTRKAEFDDQISKLEAELEAKYKENMMLVDKLNDRSLQLVEQKQKLYKQTNQRFSEIEKALTSLEEDFMKGNLDGHGKKINSLKRDVVSFRVDKDLQETEEPEAEGSEMLKDLRLEFENECAPQIEINSSSVGQISVDPPIDEGSGTVSQHMLLLDDFLDDYIESQTASVNKAFIESKSNIEDTEEPLESENENLKEERPFVSRLEKRRDGVDDSRLQKSKQVERFEQEMDDLSVSQQEKLVFSILNENSVFEEEKQGESEYSERPSKVKSAKLEQIRQNSSEKKRRDVKLEDLLKVKEAKNEVKHGKAYKENENQVMQTENTYDQRESNTKAIFHSYSTSSGSLFHILDREMKEQNPQIVPQSSNEVEKDSSPSKIEQDSLLFDGISHCSSIKDDSSAREEINDFFPSNEAQDRPRAPYQPKRPLEIDCDLANELYEQDNDQAEEDQERSEIEVIDDYDLDLESNEVNPAHERRSVSPQPEFNSKAEEDFYYFAQDSDDSHRNYLPQRPDNPLQRRTPPQKHVKSVFEENKVEYQLKGKKDAASMRVSVSAQKPKRESGGSQKKQEEVDDENGRNNDKQINNAVQWNTFSLHSGKQEDKGNVPSPEVLEPLKKNRKSVSRQKAATNENSFISQHHTLDNDQNKKSQKKAKKERRRISDNVAQQKPGEQQFYDNIYINYLSEKPIEYSGKPLEAHGHNISQGRSHSSETKYPNDQNAEGVKLSQKFLKIGSFGQRAASSAAASDSSNGFIQKKLKKMPKSSKTSIEEKKKRSLNNSRKKNGKRSVQREEHKRASKFSKSPAKHQNSLHAKGNIDYIMGNQNNSVNLGNQNSIYGPLKKVNKKVNSTNMNINILNQNIKNFNNSKIITYIDKPGYKGHDQNIINIDPHANQFVIMRPQTVTDKVKEPQGFNPNKKVEDESVMLFECLDEHILNKEKRSSSQNDCYQAKKGAKRSPDYEKRMPKKVASSQKKRLNIQVSKPSGQAKNLYFAPLSKPQIDLFDNREGVKISPVLKKQNYTTKNRPMLDNSFNKSPKVNWVPGLTASTTGKRSSKENTQTHRQRQAKMMRQIAVLAANSKPRPVRRTSAKRKKSYDRVNQSMAVVPKSVLARAFSPVDKVRKNVQVKSKSRPSSSMAVTKQQNRQKHEYSILLDTAGCYIGSP